MAATKKHIHSNKWHAVLFPYGLAVTFWSLYFMWQNIIPHNTVATVILRLWGHFWQSTTSCALVADASKCLACTTITEHQTRALPCELRADSNWNIVRRANFPPFWKLLPAKIKLGFCVSATNSSAAWRILFAHFVRVWMLQQRH